eukprot:m.21138 g.21138  ORF g.21138 m.21138 type:complete len:751 (+) comp7048_c0_seq1:119-2371(+)
MPSKLHLVAFLLHYGFLLSSAQVRYCCPSKEQNSGIDACKNRAEFDKVCRRMTKSCRAAVPVECKQPAPCEGVPCQVNSKCDPEDNLCKCKSGFYMLGGTLCVKVSTNGCKKDGDCSMNQECIVDAKLNKKLCQCKETYGVDPSTKSESCVAKVFDSYCQNAAAELVGFACKCQKGYVGSGTVCCPADSSGSGNNCICNVNTICTDPKCSTSEDGVVSFPGRSTKDTSFCETCSCEQTTITSTTRTTSSTVTCSPIYRGTLHESSFKSCDDFGLEWSTKKNGNSNYCEMPGVQNKCSLGLNFSEAAFACQAVGARLCTSQEVVSGGSTGCGFDSKFAWTSSRCIQSQCNGWVLAKPRTTKSMCVSEEDKAGIALRCCADRRTSSTTSTISSVTSSTTISSTTSQSTTSATVSSTSSSVTSTSISSTSSSSVTSSSTTSMTSTSVTQSHTTSLTSTMGTDSMTLAMTPGASRTSTRNSQESTSGTVSSLRTGSVDTAKSESNNNANNITVVAVVIVVVVLGLVALLFFVIWRRKTSANNGNSKKNTIINPVYAPASDATYASYNSIYNFAMDLEEVSGQHVRTTHDAYETSDAPPPIPSKSYFGTRRKADVPTKVNTPATYENWTASQDNRDVVWNVGVMSRVEAEGLILASSDSCTGSFVIRQSSAHPFHVLTILLVKKDKKFEHHILEYKPDEKKYFINNTGFNTRLDKLENIIDHLVKEADQISVPLVLPTAESSSLYGNIGQLKTEA